MHAAGFKAVILMHALRARKQLTWWARKGPVAISGTRQS